MKEILSNIQCHTFFLIRKWSIETSHNQIRSYQWRCVYCM